MKKAPLFLPASVLLCLLLLQKPQATFRKRPLRFFAPVLENCIFSPLVRAVVLGDKKEISTSIKYGFKKLGALHFLVVSGLHVGLIGGLVLLLSGSVALATVVVFVYALLVGFSPPALRAAAVFFLAGVGKLLNRDVNPFNVVSLSMLLLLLFFWPPNVSFFLTYFATYSVLMVSEVTGKLAWLGVPLLTSVYMFPFIAHYFGYVSFLSPFSTLLLTPVFYAFLPVAFLSVLVPPVQFFVKGFERLFYLLSRIPEFGLSGVYLSKPALLFYWALFCFGYYIKKIRWMVPAVGVLLPLVSFALSQGDKGVYFFPQQGAVLVFCNGRESVVMGDGPKPLGYKVCEFLRKNGISKIKRLLVCRSDKCGFALPIMESFSVDVLMDTGCPTSKKDYWSLMELMEAKKVKYELGRKGESFEFAEWHFEVLYPFKKLAFSIPSRDSMVILCRAGRLSILFRDGLSWEAEPLFLSSNKKIRAKILIAEWPPSERFIGAIRCRKLITRPEAQPVRKFGLKHIRPEEVYKVEIGH